MYGGGRTAGTRHSSNSRRIGALSMTPTLVQRHLPHAGRVPRVDLCARARDWAEIQERMLVPLYEAVYERLEVGEAAGTRLLGLGCGSGLALLMAASRGAAVTGVEAAAPERLALARERLQGETRSTRARGDTRLTEGGPGDAAEPDDAPYNLITAFQPIGCMAGDSEGLGALLESASPFAERGTPVVLVELGSAGAVRDVVGPAGRDEARRSAAQRGQLAAGAPRRPGGGHTSGRAQAGRLGPGRLSVRLRGRGQRRARAAVDGAVRRGDRRDGPVPGREGDDGGTAPASAAGRDGMDAERVPLRDRAHAVTVASGRSPSPGRRCPGSPESPAPPRPW